MNPRIASIENLIARDPGGRNVFALVVAGQLRLAAQSLRLAKRVGIVSGFYVPEVGAAETDGPPGAKVVGDALVQLGIDVDYITDAWNAPLFDAIGLTPLLDVARYLDDSEATHLVSIERVGRARDGRYRNMRGVDVTDTTAPLDELFIEAGRRGITTIGIGDGGNEIGMARVFADASDTIDHGAAIASTVLTDFCIAAGVSNWGAYGLAGALSVLVDRDLLPTAAAAAETIERAVAAGGAVDGVTHRREATVDGVPLADSVRMLENIRRQIAPSPLASARALLVGVLGYGETGRAAATLLAARGHRVCVSDAGGIALTGTVRLAGVETGGHTIGFLRACDLVVTSPGVRPDATIRNELHHCGVPVMSELEMAYQLGDRPLIAVTGTIGKRTTVELLRRVFERAGRSLAIGGNRGRPLSALVLDAEMPGAAARGAGGHGAVTRCIPECDVDTRAGADGAEAGCSADAGGATQRRGTVAPGAVAAPAIAIAVSSFQLETVVSFRPAVAVILNIEDAHMDRHGTPAEYARIKSRVFMNQRPDDVLVLNYDDARVRSLARKHEGRTFFVSKTQPVDRGAWLVDRGACLNVAGETERVSLDIDTRSGRGARPEHADVFAENILATIVVARVCGLTADAITHGLAGSRTGDARNALHPRHTT
ncbi:MAG: glutamate cyclase domain-containing protein [Phycisphaerae bacterium]